MVQTVVDRLESGFDVAEIHDPAGLLAGLAFHFEFHPEGVAVQARALVARRHVGEVVSGLEGKDFEDFHGRIVAVGRGCGSARPLIVANENISIRMKRC